MTPAANASRWVRIYRWQYPLFLVLGQIVGLWLFAVGALLIHKSMLKAEPSRVIAVTILALIWIAMLARSDWRVGLVVFSITGCAVAIGANTMPPTAEIVGWFAAGVDWQLSYTWLTHLFLHRDWSHLVNNLFGLLVASGVLVWSGNKLREFGVIAACALVGDLLVALTARPDVHLIGISGITYGLSIAAAVRSFPTTKERVVTQWHLFLLGVTVWGVGLGGLVPDQAAPHVSYQAHIGGTMGGVVACVLIAWWNAKRRAQPPVPAEVSLGHS